MSRIETNIEELEQYIDNCKYSPLSNSKIVVNRDELLDLIDNLKRNIPEEIKKYQRIIANRDAILRDAQDKSEEMIKKANEMTSQLVSEHEVMHQAYKEANAIIEQATAQAGEIIDKATAQANTMKDAAVQYTDDSLATIQKILNDAIEGITVNFDGIKRALDSSLEVTIENRNALADQMGSGPEKMRPDIHEEDDDGPEAYYSPESSGFSDPGMSVEEASRAGQIDIDYDDIRYGRALKNEDLDDFSLDISDFD